MLKHESIHEQDYYPWVVGDNDDRGEVALGDGKALYWQKTKCCWLTSIHQCHSNVVFMPL